MFTLHVKNNVNIVVIDASRANSEISEKFNFFLSKQNYSSKYILFDFTPCDYIDSTFLGVVVRNFLKMKKNDYILKIASSEKVTFILDNVSHLSSIIDIYPSVEEALNSFN